MFRRALILASVVVLVDQASKFWLIALMQEVGRPIELTGFFNLVMVWNRGISFGLFQSGETGRWLLTLLAIGVCIVLLVWLRRVTHPLSGYGIGAVLGGAIGNVIDRASPRAAVADFFDAHLMGYHWPAFNVADMAIALGVGAILLHSFLDDGSRESAEQRTEHRS